MYLLLVNKRDPDTSRPELVLRFDSEEHSEIVVIWLEQHGCESVPKFNMD